MRRIRFYLDTSVISEIGTETERGEITREFFRIVTENPDKYELVISLITERELFDSPPEKQKQFAVFLEKTTHTALPRDKEAENLARLYVIENVLSNNHIDDLTHIAYAVVSRCDYVISWNMKHIVRVKTISGVNEVNIHNNFNRIIIVTPQFITGEFDNVNE